MILLHELQRDASLNRLKEALEDDARTVLARGIPRTARGAVTAALFAGLKQTCLLIAPDAETAELIAADAETCLGSDCGGGGICLFPPKDLVIGEATDVRAERERLATLELLMRGDPLLIIAPVVAIAQPTAPPDLFRKSRFEIRVNEEMDRDVLAGQLVDSGYERVDAVEQVGQFSVRGGVVDIYPPSGEHPYRLEFFGDMIESIRIFEISSQRSRQGVESCLISTPHEVVLTRESTERAISHVLEHYPSPHPSPLGGERGKGEGETDNDDREEASEEVLENSITRDLSKLDNLSYFPGVELYLPLLYPERPSLLDHLPEEAVILVVERHASELHLSRIKEELEKMMTARVESRRALPLVLGEGEGPQEKWMLDFETLMNRAAKRRMVFMSIGEEIAEPEESEGEAEQEQTAEEATFV